MLGFYVAIPEKMIIDTGDNLKELSATMNNISLNYNAACHNLTYECNCDTYDMTELNKRYDAIFAYQLSEVRDRCDEVQGVTWLCMHRNYCKYMDNNGFCDDMYDKWGKNLT
jgi:hypothetical protein